MGFIFDFKTNTVTQPIVFHNSFDKLVDPKIFKQNVNICNVNNIIFFDLEPDDIVGQFCYRQLFIPNIREFSMIHVTKFLPTTSTAIMDENNTNTYCYSTNVSYSDTINHFCFLYKKLDYPVIVAHNGFKFDFLLLIAHIYRYVKNPEEIVHRMKFYDSFVTVRSKYDKLKNIDLFMKFEDKYSQYGYLKHKQHKSKEDSQMLALWFNEYVRKLKN
ncbi:hypothetical protein QKT26_gp69 [Carcinus maenas nudivirus]|uniref:Exonuclease domain-containing protein n=1 Tax=Carcinus maenas nudivirus TaxID=2880837 RepID=A0AAE8Y2D4_9VIRU|nr:hypothetical protein QKT26_gp69 [Carcinus maenas nudivirus]UBZ25659.1 hypothetical protein CmNV_068 [Carcinus maenas nudivirus]